MSCSLSACLARVSNFSYLLACCHLCQEAVHLPHHLHQVGGSLRHHRGQLNVLPYGEIRQLKNNSRDWMIMKLEFRLTYDTDLNLVKKIMKKIGAEIAADPELGKDLIEPLKSQGVYSTEDSALVVRAKFMAKPGSTVFMIRRVAYDKAFVGSAALWDRRRAGDSVPERTAPLRPVLRRRADDAGTLQEQRRQERRRDAMPGRPKTCGR